MLWFRLTGKKLIRLRENYKKISITFSRKGDRTPYSILGTLGSTKTFGTQKMSLYQVKGDFVLYKQPCSLPACKHELNALNPLL